MQAQPAVDVSALPESVLDHRSLVWWGNLLLLAIETTMFALLLAAYFYIRPNFSPWPPPQVNGPVAIYNSVPALRLPTLNLGVLLLSLAPIILADRACLRRDRKTVTRALWFFIALAATCIALRFREFWALKFRWDDNAYASVAWTLMGMHLLHLFVGTLELVIMQTWILVNGLDDKHARDVRVTAFYWYWVVGVWALIYAIIFLGPRFL
jgi:heme/copper-type cytochrome/quinol oxidase subunit 3